MFDDFLSKENIPVHVTEKNKNLLIPGLKVVVIFSKIPRVACTDSYTRTAFFRAGILGLILLYQVYSKLTGNQFELASVLTKH